MNKKNNSILGQIQRNAVALISLVIALSTLSYNTWRNEKSEDNHNHRRAAFEILLKLNELQRVVFHLRYDRELLHQANPRLGWTYVLTIQDLSRIMEAPMPAEADKLHATWSEHWDDLASNQESVDVVLKAIDGLRLQSLDSIKSLE